MCYLYLHKSPYLKSISFSLEVEKIVLRLSFYPVAQLFCTVGSMQ